MLEHRSSPGLLEESLHGAPQEKEVKLIRVGKKSNRNQITSIYSIYRGVCRNCTGIGLAFVFRLRHVMEHGSRNYAISCSVTSCFGRICVRHKTSCAVREKTL